MSETFHVQYFMKESCLAYCYSYLVHYKNIDCVTDLNIQMTKDIINGALTWNCISFDGFVNNPELLIFRCSCGTKKAKVYKKDIQDLKEIKEACPVRFDYNGASHWVVVENGKIIFDSWKDSQSVKYGKPTTARIIEWEG